MKFESKLTRKLLSKVVKNLINKKLQCQAELKINTLKVVIADGNVHIHADAEADMPQDDLLKLIHM